MRISLWQQFSSNHSASFTLVGKFASPEIAQEVANEIRQLLRATATWWTQFEGHDYWSKMKELEEAGELTPPEVEFSQKYGVEWFTKNSKVQPLDWIGRYPATIGDRVVTYRNIVFLENWGNTWAGPTPFDQIMKLYDAILACDCELNEDHYLTVSISCLAPDEATAEAIVNAVKVPYPIYVRFPQQGNPSPGKVSRDGRLLNFQYLKLCWAGIKMDTQEHFQFIIAYLESQHCTNIDCNFIEVPIDGYDALLLS